GDEGRAIVVLVALEIVGVGADQAVAIEETELRFVGEGRPVAVLGDEDVARPLAPNDWPAQRPMGEWKRARGGDVEIVRAIFCQQPRREARFFPGCFTPERRELGKAFQALAG